MTQFFFLMKSNSVRLEFLSRVFDFVILVKLIEQKNEKKMNRE